MRPGYSFNNLLLQNNRQNISSMTKDADAHEEGSTSSYERLILRFEHITVE